MSKDELDALTKGGYMWEKDAVSQTRKFGVFGDLMNVVKAVAGELLFLKFYLSHSIFFSLCIEIIGGAQIEKNKYGET